MIDPGRNRNVEGTSTILDECSVTTDHVFEITPIQKHDIIVVTSPENPKDDSKYPVQKPTIGTKHTSGH